MKKVFPLLILLLASCQPQGELVILHTNDTHSQITPVTSGSNKDLGGYARRMGYIAEERVQHPSLLLFDSGDFSQGTPYFNYFHGRVEVDAFNRMKYDAVTLGNHEFDNGVDTLAIILRDLHAKVVCCNYDVEGTVLESLVKPYIIIERGGYRIGVTGVGHNPENLIAATNFAPIKYLNPLPIANDIADYLSNQAHCDLVICLSHLGVDADAEGVCDQWLATNSTNIDIILGGHSHTIIENEYITNAIGKRVLLSQMGKAGARVGRICITPQ